jgi:hypothetical protein
MLKMTCKYSFFFTNVAQTMYVLLRPDCYFHIIAEFTEFQNLQNAQIAIAYKI